MRFKGYGSDLRSFLIGLQAYKVFRNLCGRRLQCGDITANSGMKLLPSFLATIITFVQSTLLKSLLRPPSRYIECVGLAGFQIGNKFIPTHSQSLAKGEKNYLLLTIHHFLPPPDNAKNSIPTRTHQYLQSAVRRPQATMFTSKFQNFWKKVFFTTSSPSSFTVGCPFTINFSNIGLGSCFLANK